MAVAVRSATRCSSVSFERLQLPLGLFAFHGIADRTGQQPAADLPFRQEILSALADGLHARVLVVQPGHHHDGQMRGRRVDLRDRADAAAVGQARDPTGSRRTDRRQAADRVRHQFHVRHLERFLIHFGQHVLQQHRVGRAVFDQKQANGRVGSSATPRPEV